MPVSDNPTPPPLIRRLPNTAFGISLGLGGHAVLWNVADTSVVTGHIVSSCFNWIFWVAALSTAVATSLCFVLKLKFYPSLIVEEWNHPVRVHFFNAPHLIVVLLCNSLPFTGNVQVLRAFWILSALSQLVITLSVYQRWMFDPESKLSNARPQFLLSTVGWFMLSVFGSYVDLKSAWGLDLPAFCFGAGSVFYFMVVIAIFNGLHETPKGSPALFLLIAPAAVACVALEALTGDFGLGSRFLLGWCLVLFLLLARIGPTILEKPPSLGVYWAYVFPLAALATACIKYSEYEATTSSRVLAWIFVGVAILSLAIVFVRMTWHTLFVCSGNDVWGDPLLTMQFYQSMPEELMESEEDGQVEFIMGCEACVDPESGTIEMDCKSTQDDLTIQAKRRNGDMKNTVTI